MSVRQLIWRLDKPERMTALYEARHRLPPHELGELFAFVVKHNESLHASEWAISGIMDCLEETGGKNPPMDWRRWLMSDAEWDRFQKLLKAPSTLYRGHARHNTYGYSWTLSPGKARWFARRSASIFPDTHSGLVSSFVPSPEDMVAYFDTDEKEVLIRNPRALGGATTLEHISSDYDPMAAIYAHVQATPYFARPDVPVTMAGLLDDEQYEEWITGLAIQVSVLHDYGMVTAATLREKVLEEAGPLRQARGSW